MFPGEQRQRAHLYGRTRSWCLADWLRLPHVQAKLLQDIGDVDRLECFGWASILVVAQSGRAVLWAKFHGALLVLPA